MSWDGTRRMFSQIGAPHSEYADGRPDPTIGFFWCLLLFHIALWTALPTVCRTDFPAETQSLLTAGSQLSWGYEHVPPLAVWMAGIVDALRGTAIWPIYLLGQLCSAISVWAAWRMARKFLHPWTALCAAIVLLGGYSCTLAGTEFSGAHLAGSFWSVAILAFHTALTGNRRRYWVATGICLGLGFLSSYGSLLLLVTMLIFTLWDESARKCWDSSWPFLSGLAFALVLLPHVLWLGNHEFVTVQTHLEPFSTVVHHFAEPLAYLGTQLLCLVPVVILLAPLVSWFSLEEPARKDDDGRDFARRYLLWMTCLPPAVVFALSLVAGPASKIFAGIPSWTYLGIVALLWSHLEESRPAWRLSLVRTGLAIGLFSAFLITFHLMVPELQRTVSASSTPSSTTSSEEPTPTETSPRAELTPTPDTSFTAIPQSLPQSISLGEPASRLEPTPAANTRSSPASPSRLKPLSEFQGWTSPQPAAREISTVPNAQPAAPQQAETLRPAPERTLPMFNFSDVSSTIPNTDQAREMPQEDRRPASTIPVAPKESPAQPASWMLQ